MNTGPTVKEGKIEPRRKREEGTEATHTHSYTSCLLMSWKPEIFERKHITMDVCRVEV